MIGGISGTVEDFQGSGHGGDPVVDVTLEREGAGTTERKLSNRYCCILIYWCYN